MDALQDIDLYQHADDALWRTRDFLSERGDLGDSPHVRITAGFNPRPKDRLVFLPVLL